jgi:hypothetical protein
LEKKDTTDSPKSVLNKKNKVEEGGALGFKVKREQESIDIRAQKMMRDRGEPSIMLTMVHAMLIVVQVAKQIAKVS